MKKKKFLPIYCLWLGVFIVLPLILILILSLSKNVDGNLSFSMEGFERFFRPIYMGVLGRSLWLAFISTLFCLLLGYPMAYILSKEKANRRNVLLLMFMIPLWMNFLLRTYAWMSILGKHGLINNFLALFGLPRLSLIYNDFAIILGMVYNFIPFMILPIYSVLIKMDQSLIESAKDLGAKPRQVFTKVILPLSFPGVITGITMVFIPAVSTFVIPGLLGGNKTNLIGNIIEQQFRWTGNWNFGSALSIILMILILISMTIMSKFGQHDQGGDLW